MVTFPPEFSRPGLPAVPVVNGEGARRLALVLPGFDDGALRAVADRSPQTAFAVPPHVTDTAAPALVDLVAERAGGTPFGILASEHSIPQLVAAMSDRRRGPHGVLVPAGADASGLFNAAPLTDFATYEPATLTVGEGRWEAAAAQAAAGRHNGDALRSYLDNAERALAAFGEELDQLIAKHRFRTPFQQAAIRRAFARHAVDFRDLVPAVMVLNGDVPWDEAPGGLDIAVAPVLATNCADRSRALALVLANGVVANSDVVLVDHQSPADLGMGMVRYWRANEPVNTHLAERLAMRANDLSGSTAVVVTTGHPRQAAELLRPYADDHRRFVLTGTRAGNRALARGLAESGVDRARIAVTHPGEADEIVVSPGARRLRREGVTVTGLRAAWPQGNGNAKRGRPPGSG